MEGKKHILVIREENEHIGQLEAIMGLLREHAEIDFMSSKDVFGDDTPLCNMYKRPEERKKYDIVIMSHELAQYLQDNAKTGLLH